MAQTTKVFIGIKGTVLALDRATGQEMWRSKLKGAEFVNVVLQDGDLFAATEGELYSLDLASGAIRWHNPLKGLGRGLITVASSGVQQTVPMNQMQQEAAAAAGATVVSSTA